MTTTANQIWGDDWEQVRRLWLLDPEIAHCNHGSFGAVPASVLAVQDGFRARMVANPMRWFSRDMPVLVGEARAEVARFIGADAEDVAFVSNVSAAATVLSQSFSLAAGDEVVTTDHIYGAVGYAVDRLCARTGARRVIVSIPVGASDETIVALIAEHCTERTGLVVIDQVTSGTSRIFPVAEVARIAHGVEAAVFVDGAHAVGMLPVDVPAIGADFWVGNLHKWPCAPAGSAVLWVAPPRQKETLSLIVNWSEHDGFPTSFDHVGTDDLSAWLAAPHALELFASLGWDRVRAHNEALVRWAQTRVADALGIAPDRLRHDPGLSMALVPLPEGAVVTREAARALQQHMVRLGVEMTVSGERGGAIRLSAQVYNQPADYERLAAGVREFLAA